MVALSRNQIRYAHMLLASTAYTASLIAVPFPGQAKFIDGTLARRHSQCQASEDWAGLEPAVTPAATKRRKM